MELGRGGGADRAACALAMNHPGSSEGCGPWAPTGGSSVPISVSQALAEARRGLWTLHVDPDVSMGIWLFSPECRPVAIGLCVSVNEWESVCL